MAIKTLEHIDGKIVKFSTITSQYPQVFVQRKKNTGELIITTDTDLKYGFHHIYLGGEHIAGGYGFATPEMRDDLTYVQETYRGTFNYFNQAYTYLANSYVGTQKYIGDAYTFLLNYIKNSSYLNSSVNSYYDRITAGNSTYVFSFENGELFVTPITLSYVSISSECCYLPYNVSYTFKNNGNAYQYGYVIVNVDRFKGTDSLNTKSITYYYSNAKCSDFTTGYADAANYNLTEYLQTKSYICVPVKLNENTSFSLSYLGDNDTVHYSNVLEFIWVDPIFHGQVDNDKIDEIDLSTLNTKCVDIQHPEFSETINFVQPCYYCIAIPNTIGLKNVKFYVSEDLEHKEDLEGGFRFLGIAANNYNYYVTEQQNISKKLRVDIDF